jgi:hypothetical protein
MAHTERSTDILIAGAGLGGVAAALAAAEAGCSVLLTEPTEWIGGQATSQAVPPDEHPWIEDHPGCASYGRYRRMVRDTYRNAYPMTPEAKRIDRLNPGLGLVSGLCHEPRVSLAVLEAMLLPWRSNGRIRVETGWSPVGVETRGDRIDAVTFEDTAGDQVTVAARIVIDATETGELLALGEVEHIIGAESQAQTGELHALPGDPDPLDQQAITWCFAIDWSPDTDNVLDRPDMYLHWRAVEPDFWPGPLLGWDDVHPETLETRHLPLFGPEGSWDLWHYRRIVAKEQFAPGFYGGDIVAVNWPMIDYFAAPVIGVDDDAVERNLWECRQLSLSLLHWMQTEAPRHDGGYGYPEVRLRPDVTGDGPDGLAIAPYIRESRRMLAEYTIAEQDVGVEARAGQDRAASYPDSVGIGSYRIDLHPSTGQRTYVDVSSYPFELPLGALIPRRVENLLPACKNIGSTHITNGCYRLHPVEWLIGDVAGSLAAAAMDQDVNPSAIRNDATRLADFQRHLVEQRGFELHWSDDIATQTR